jgi:hypothetical protein
MRTVFSVILSTVKSFIGGVVAFAGSILTVASAKWSSNRTPWLPGWISRNSFGEEVQERRLTKVDVGLGQSRS